MAEIIPFPKKEVKSKLDFEDVVETALTVTAVNLYGNMYNSPLATPHDLDTFDIYYIKDCVDKASRSNVFSQPAREKFTSISSMIQSKL
jgi:hypothetical protein